ncbi:MAG: DUF5996 family protein [Actinomycetota bacterium]
MSDTPDLPALPLEAWEPTKVTLHLYAQIVGKVRLATAAPRNHWWHVPLYVDVTGLTTRRLHHRGVTFQVDFDLLDHALRVRCADGRGESFPLHDGLSVAAFDRELHAALGRLGIDVALVEHPFGVPMTTPFPADEEHSAYDPEYVRRFWRILDWVDGVFEEFAGWFCGKTSPVHLFWHSLDLAVTRFSGREGGVSPGADRVTREAYSHEVISFGFWPGDPTMREPAFYSYTAPEPAGLASHPLFPAEARWTEQPTGALAVLPYEAVRSAADPRRALLAFLQSAYDAGGIAAGWDRAGLASTYSPAPPQLAALLTAAR